MDVNRASHLFQEASQEEIAALFHAALGEGDIRSSRLLSGGLFNTTYYVEYGPEHRRAVLRLGPVNRHLLLGHELNLMAAEVLMCGLCQVAEVPCSRILAWDASRQHIARDWMIVEYIPSVVMAEAKLPEDEKSRLRRQVGTYLNRLHQVEGDSFGYLSRIAMGIRFGSWREAFMFEAEDILTRLEAYRPFPPEVFAALRRRFASGGPVLDEIKTPQLLHTDMWEGNVLLTEDAREIAAVIDGDRAVFGDVDFEFASEWGAGLTSLCGREPPGSGSPARRERMSLYRLYYVLLEAYVWTAEYDGPEVRQEKQNALLALLREKQ